jgi:hypothetical protein
MEGPLRRTYRASWYKVLGFLSVRRRAQNVGLVHNIPYQLLVSACACPISFWREFAKTPEIFLRANLLPHVIFPEPERRSLYYVL